MTNCFEAGQPRMVFSIRRVLPAIHEDVLPTSNKVMLYKNTCAIATAGTWVERPNVCRTESIRMCQSLFGTKLVKTKNNHNAKVNQLILYLIVTRRLENFFYTTKMCISPQSEPIPTSMYLS